MAENLLEKAEGALHNQPWYVWAGLLTGGGVVTWYVLRNRAMKAAKSTSSNTPSAANADLQNGYDVASLAGIPYGYITGYTSGQGPTDNYPPTPPTTQTGVIRAKNPKIGYDKNHAGVPVEKTPTGGNSPLGVVGWGASIIITGDPVSGADNGTGATLWYPVSYNGQAGYVSAYDLTNITKNSGTGSGGRASDWETGLNKHRNTVDQYHFAMIGGGDAQLV